MDSYENSLYVTVVILCIVMGTVIGAFVAALFRRRHGRLRVQKEQVLAEVALLERERGRVSQDLHDDIGPLVWAIKLHLKLGGQEHEDGAAHRERTLHYVDELNGRLRGIARNLTPRILARRGLEDALRQFVDDYQELTPMRISLECGLGPDVGSDAALQLYRIVQEVVQNAAKHSGATKLLVRLTREGRAVHLLCKDNGHGFPHPAAPERGQGLQNVTNRVALLDGRMQCVSTANGGTEYFFTFPLS
jgi:two-component system NarL family sensor kinase